MDKHGIQRILTLRSLSLRTLAYDLSDSYWLRFSSCAVRTGALIFVPGKLAPVLARIAKIPASLPLIAAILPFTVYSFAFAE
jgi:hypothetical protein